MTPEEFEKKVKEALSYNGELGIFDNEEAHSKIDDLCFDVLEEAGYTEGMKLIRKYEGDFWYA
jgi:hypothetical protein